MSGLPKMKVMEFIRLYEQSLRKEIGYWVSASVGNYVTIEQIDDKFQSIKWEDEEPVNIDEALESLK